MAGKRSSAFNLETCARPNILALEPYRCARDDYKDDGTNILLDANENAYGPGLALTEDENLEGSRKEEDGEGIDVDLLGLNRYPDPHQIPLKQLLCNLRNRSSPSPSTTPLTPSNLFVGVGSDEAIDALLRCFCRPGHDRILVCPPTYGMYSVSASVNDISLVKVPLIGEDFQVDIDGIMKALSEDKDGRIKLVYLCSPGNPTGALLKKEDVERVLGHETWNGIVVLDEAYIDFAPEGSSQAPFVTRYPNLVVLQTMSKAFGLAGIRLGAAFTDPKIARLLNAMKAPYNIPNPTSQIACAALQPKHLAAMRANVELIIQQRDRMVAELPKIPGVGKFKGGFESNFLLVEMLDGPNGKPCNEVALRVYESLAEEKGVVVRFRGKEHGCLGCLRITVGTETEVTRFLEELKAVLEGIFKSNEHRSPREEERLEEEASGVVA
ncbi:histidinol-phosphate aminotransferase [Delitschia confertaspora ATCC 74209]|uniref:histidinol-phosphate transaminase n=1 Tax=Delitschia confertaspora ATCC 74209 TaxID=1513339 RepID=A0A9P4MU22_9PLEO|nr:histidinol-phosphate aminotransferase [Delitschia confertaspora ATCC 74209]